MCQVGLIAVTKLPSEYKNFTGEVGWAMLDIDIPWRGEKVRDCVLNLCFSIVLCLTDEQYFWSANWKRSKISQTV